MKDTKVDWLPYIPKDVRTSKGAESVSNNENIFFFLTLLFIIFYYLLFINLLCTHHTSHTYYTANALNIDTKVCIPKDWQSNFR